MLCPSRRTPRRWTAALTTVFALILVYGLLPCDDPYARIEAARLHSSHTESPSLSAGANCPLPELDDVLVVLKTGATESHAKLPVLLNTTLRCVPHYTVVSDYEEIVAGVRAHDVLRDLHLSPDLDPRSDGAGKVPDTHPEPGVDPGIELYRALRTQGRQALLQEPYHSTLSDEDSNGAADEISDKKGLGKVGNAGWLLDKWKFLPMVEAAVLARPTAQWFVFVEADSYVVWANLAAWLGRLDPARAYYLGAPMQSGNNVFGYGGAGIVLSQAAVQRVVRLWRGEGDGQGEGMVEGVMEKRTAAHWAGDAVLGAALADVGVELVWAWPMLQPGRPWEVEYLREGDGELSLWCYPAVSYHHMSAADVRALWAFEQAWFRDEKNGVLLHGDVFKGFLFNGIAPQQDDWDNLAGEPTGGMVDSFDECARECDRDVRCLQFSFRNGTCMTAPSVVRGVRRQGVQSGWMSSRIESVVSRIDSCPETEYIFE